MNYAVEWRIINAADYGYAQRRRRVFLAAFHKSTIMYNDIETSANSEDDIFLYNQLYSSGFFSSIFPVKPEVDTEKQSRRLLNQISFNDLFDLSDTFSAPFYNSGMMIDGNVISQEVKPVEVRATTLGEIRHTEPVDEKYFLNGSLEKWQYLKGAKKIERIRPNGEPYYFSEGAICFPDYLDKPARTMLTSESTINRSTHVIEDAVTGNLRVLTPIECERLNGFDDDWTNTGMPEKSRYFTMGNALVVPVVEKIGDRILELT